MASKCIFLVLVSTFALRGEATAFLKATPKHVTDKVSEEDIQASLLGEIEGSLGSGLASKRINEIKTIISPMFNSLPKNEHGNLGNVTVRYVMHRVFVQRHGWFIEGLDNAGAAWNASAPTGILKNQVPAYIENMFEKRLGGRGLGLHEVAVFAATIEHLIHSEGIGRLGSALNVHELLPTEMLSIAQADEVLDTYMMAYLLSWDLTKMTKQRDAKRKAKMPEIYPGWADTQAFVRKIRQEVTSSMAVASAPEQQQLSFALLAKVAETVGEEFGTFQNIECKALKGELLKMEDHGTGRVRLSDFYKDALDGKDGAWQFQESIAYLRQLGALDESNADEPRVMIANYLISRTNCIASSDYYSVCCHNECEDLMVKLENTIAAPEATSEQIAKLISALPSATVSAPRVLSETLRTRLDKIGADHGGSVQLHSRLFSQWMHHAFPRECPYPHMSGTTSQDKAMDWGEASTSTHEEMKQFAKTNIAQSEAPEDMHDLMMWSHDEELLVSRPAVVPVTDRGFAGAARTVAGIAAVASLVFALLRTAAPAMGGNDKDMQQKFMV